MKLCSFLSFQAHPWMSSGSLNTDPPPSSRGHGCAHGCKMTAAFSSGVCGSEVAMTCDCLEPSSDKRLNALDFNRHARAHTHKTRQTAHWLDRELGLMRCRGNTHQLCSNHGCHGDEFTAGLWSHRACIRAACFSFPLSIFIAHIINLSQRG